MKQVRCEKKKENFLKNEKKELVRKNGARELDEKKI